MLRYTEPGLNAFLSTGFLEEAFPTEEAVSIPHYTILLCMKGSCCVQADARQIDLGRSTVLTLSPGALLEIDRLQTERIHCVQFNREFYCVEYHDVEVSCNGLLFNAATQAPAIDVPPAEGETLALLMQMFEKEFANADRLQLEMLRVLLKRMIITCTRLVKEQLEERRDLRASQTDLLRAFSGLVEKHYREKHKVAEYASMLHRSPKTLSNLFT
ncbi:MAG: AraC family transcriptional regulator, partial [Bacteroidota bacterium]|nr:AraC family transcriptional regulator [Bacteroidota bacterium]